MIRLLLVFSLLGFGVFASAGNVPEKLEQVISLEQFRTLTKEQKVIYIRGLQNLLVDLNQQEAPDRGAQNSRLRELLLPTAFAEVVHGNTVGGPCIFAGNVLRFASNGYCPRPPQGSCLRGQIQCNALVFGDGVCTAPNSRATYNCMQSAKPVNDIIAYAESHKEDWQNLSNTLGDYCTKTETQGLPCRLVQGRLNEMRKVADIPDAPPTSVEPPKIADKKPMPRARPPVAGKVTPPKIDEPPRPPMPIPPPPPLAPKPDVAPKVAQKEHVAGKVAVACDTTKLYEAVRCRFDPVTKAESLRSLMIYTDAYSAFCESKTLPKDFDKIARENFEAAKKCVTTSMNSKAPGAISQAIGKYYLNQLNNVIMPNYEKCIADMKNGALPASKHLGSMELEYRTDSKGNRNIFAVARPKGKSPEEMGPMYFVSKTMDKKYSLCDLEYSGKIGGATAATGKAKTAK